MTDQLPTTVLRSDGSEVAIASLENGHIHRTHAKHLREKGPDDPHVRALAAVIAQRDAENPAPQTDTHRLAPAADRTVTKADNAPPEVDERAAFKARLEEHPDAVALLKRFAALELSAAKLPKAEAIKTDADIAKVDAWVRDAVQLRRDVDAFHERAKSPWLMRGQVVDAFKREIGGGIDERGKAMEMRKRPYLLAKAAREQAERDAKAKAERQAAAEQRQREQEARERQERADQAAREEEARLARAESDRQMEEARAAAMADAEDTEPDFSHIDTTEVDDAEDRLRASRAAADAAAAEAIEAARAADNAEQRAEDAEAPTHQLAKTGESGLKAVWKHRIDSPRALAASLGPLEPFLKEADITAALERAAKADPRPTIPGVSFFEDYDVTTNTRVRSPSRGHLPGSI